MRGLTVPTTATTEAPMSQTVQEFAEQLYDRLSLSDSTTDQMEIAAALTKRYGHGGEPLTEADLRETLGEAVHTSFRKGGDGPLSMAVWHAIDALPPDEWAATLDFLAWGLGVTFGLPEADAEDDEQEDAK
jgi:hypothetical protein